MPINDYELDSHSNKQYYKRCKQRTGTASHDWQEFTMKLSEDFCNPAYDEGDALDCNSH